MTGKNELAVYSLTRVPSGKRLTGFIRGSLAPLTSEGADLLAGPDSNLLSDGDEGIDLNEGGEGLDPNHPGTYSVSRQRMLSRQRKEKGKMREEPAPPFDISMMREDGSVDSPPRRKKPKPVGRAMKVSSSIYISKRRSLHTHA